MDPGWFNPEPEEKLNFPSSCHTVWNTGILDQMLQGSLSNSVSCLSHICEEEQQEDDDDAPGRVYHKSGSRDWINWYFVWSFSGAHWWQWSPLLKIKTLRQNLCCKHCWQIFRVIWLDLCTAFFWPFDHGRLWHAFCSVCFWAVNLPWPWGQAGILVPHCLPLYPPPLYKHALSISALGAP